MPAAQFQSRFADTAPQSAAPIDWVRLNYIRIQYARSRCAPRLDLFRACTMITPDPAVGLEICTDALVRCLGQALNRMPVFYRPGANTFSFDEAWLLRVLAAVQYDDHDSLTFLVARRVSPPQRRAFVRLVRLVAQNWNNDRV